MVRQVVVGPQARCAGLRSARVRYRQSADAPGSGEPVITRATDIPHPRHRHNPDQFELTPVRTMTRERHPKAPVLDASKTCSRVPVLSVRSPRASRRAAPVALRGAPRPRGRGRARRAVHPHPARGPHRERAGGALDGRGRLGLPRLRRALHRKPPRRARALRRREELHARLALDVAATGHARAVVRPQGGAQGKRHGRAPRARDQAARSSDHNATSARLSKRSLHAEAAPALFSIVCASAGKDAVVPWTRPKEEWRRRAESRNLLQLQRSRTAISLNPHGMNESLQARLPSPRAGRAYARPGPVGDRKDNK